MELERHLLWGEKLILELHSFPLASEMDINIGLITCRGASRAPVPRFVTEALSLQRPQYQQCRMDATS